MSGIGSMDTLDLWGPEVVDQEGHGCVAAIGSVARRVAATLPTTETIQSAVYLLTGRTRPPQPAPLSMTDEKICWAVYLGDTETIRRLVEEGTDVGSLRTSTGIPAFWTACWRGHVDIVRLLLAKGTDSNIQPEYMYPAICAAADSNRPKVIKLLIAHDKKGSLAHIDAKGGVYYKHEEAAKVLLVAGARVDFVTEDGETDLHRAARFGSPSIIRKLVVRRLNVNATNLRGETALHIAAREAHNEAIKALVRAGADINAKALEQMTPLLVAWEKRYEGRFDEYFVTAQVLIDLGANLDGLAEDEIGLRLELEWIAARAHRHSKSTWGHLLGRRA